MLKLHLVVFVVYRVRQKKVAPQSFFDVFSATVWSFVDFFTNLYIDILLSKCQVIYYSVEKQRNYGLF